VGLGNLGNFVYVGTGTGKIFVSQNAGGSWLPISLGLLDNSPIQQIITDPARGSHDAYAVTADGVYYLQDSVQLGNNPTNTQFQWVNITGDLKAQAYSIFGQAYNPTTDPNSKPYSLTNVINSISANWNYMIPNNPNDLTQGYHPVLYVSGNSGVYMSTDNGKNWFLYPESKYGAVVDGGDMPHVNVTDLTLSQGNIAVATGMPNLAGPYDTFTGTLTTGSTSITNLSGTTNLAVGQEVIGNGIPSGTTIVSINNGAKTLTLSAPVTGSGTENFTTNMAADPDLLLAATYGEGEFAINVGPMLLNPDSATLGPRLDQSSVSGTAADGTSLVTTATPLFDGTSEISAFGNATRISIVDETPGDSTFGQVIGGFDSNNVAATNVSANWTDAFGNFSIPVNAGAFTSNGLKTVELYATDDAGAVGNKVMISFTLQVTGISPPTAPTTPTLQLAPYDVTGQPGYTNIANPNLIGTTSSNATVNLYLFGSSTVIATTTADANGNFTVTFPDMTGGVNGTYKFTVVAQATNSVGSSGFSTPPTTFTIIIGTPAAPTNFRLDPTTDTGIKANPLSGTGVPSDNITANRTPDYIGTTEPGATVELFVAGSSTIWATATADSTGAFSIQLPFALTNGSISLYVEAVDLAGNLSPASNLLTLMIVSITSDYNGDSYADAALFDPQSTTFTGKVTSGSPSISGISSTAGLVAGEYVSGTGIPVGTTILNVKSSTAITLSANATASGSPSLTAGQGTWLVQNTSLAQAAPPPPPFWFASGTAFGPANVTPFQGDFDGDGLSDLAYYQSSTATWYMEDSKTGLVSSFTLGTPNVSVPVVGYFDANAPEEAAVYTYVSGTGGVWTIASGISGTRTVTVPGEQKTDIPVPGDYTGVGYDELAVYRPSTGQFLVQVPQSNGTTITQPILIPGISVGVPGHSPSPDLTSLVPVPGNYDPYYNSTTNSWVENTEAAVYDPKTGVFTILGPHGVDSPSPTFKANDIPVPADYAGNGSTQAVVFRPSTGQFIAVGGKVIATFGQASTNIPLAAPLSYRTPKAADPPPGKGGGTGGGSGTGTGTGTKGTGTGTGTTGSGGSSGTGTTGKKSGGSGTGSSGSKSTGGTHSGSGSHKKTVTPPKKPKPATHPKKAPAHAKTKKKEVAPAPKHQVKVVSHTSTKAVKVVSAVPAPAKAPTHVVDLALEHVHVNLRKS
jgi:hypothetical protein